MDSKLLWLLVMVISLCVEMNAQKRELQTESDGFVWKKVSNNGSWCRRC